MIPPVLMQIFVGLVLKFCLGGKFMPIDDLPSHPVYCTMDATDPYFLLPFINRFPAFLSLCPPKPPIQMEYAPLTVTLCEEPLESVAFAPTSSPAANARTGSGHGASTYPVPSGLPNILASTQHHLSMAIELRQRLLAQAHTSTRQLVRAIRATRPRLVRSLQKMRPRPLTLVLLTVILCLACAFGERHLRLTELKAQYATLASQNEQLSLNLRGTTQHLERRALHRDLIAGAGRRLRGREATSDD